MEAMIAQGGLADGNRLPPERDLATQFGVSRTVIREAVAALSARGLLEVQAGSGTVIRRPRVDSIGRMISLSLSIGGAGEPAPDQVRETARTIAGEAASLAAERRTEEDLETLARIVRDFEVDPSRTESTAAFLHAVASSGHNDISALLLDILLQLGGAPEHAAAPASLRNIYDAIRKADTKAARRGVRDLYDEPTTTPRALDAGAPRPRSKKDRKAQAV
jgi:DNA-binding FadR family transcriptional regulator